MSDLVSVSLGALPWSPTEDAELVEVLHGHDMPLIGIIRQHGCSYLFRCIAGQTEDTTLWAYTLLDTSRQALLAEATPENWFPVTHAVFEGSHAVLALATEGAGILTFTELRDFDLDGVESALRSLLVDLEGRLEAHRRGLEEGQQLAAPGIR